jgi:hypothetical protein
MTITRNIVGLARFLFLVFTPHIRIRRGKKHSIKEAQLEKHIGPTIPFTDKEPIFCTKCHTLMCWKAKSDGDTVIVDMRGNILRMGNITVIDKDGEKGELSMKCPNGHSEVIKCRD